MAKDYGRRAAQKQRAPKRILLILSSFLCGYLTATVFDFASLSNWLSSNIFSKKQNKVQVQAKTTPPAPPQPKFEFYTLLAKDQSARSPLASKPALANAKPPVSVSQPPLAATSRANETTTAASKTVTTTKESYQIQVASFKNKQDAEQLKATLILKGFDVMVVSNAQQQMNWFRVIVGPFNSLDAAQKAQTVLAQNERIKGMIRKLV